VKLLLIDVDDPADSLCAPVLVLADIFQKDGSD